MFTASGVPGRSTTSSSTSWKVPSRERRMAWKTAVTCSWKHFQRSSAPSTPASTRARPSGLPPCAAAATCCSFANPSRTATSPSRSPATLDAARRTSPSLKLMERSAPPPQTVSTPDSRDWCTKPTRSAMGRPFRSPARMQRGRDAAPPAAGVRRARQQIGRGREQEEPRRPGPPARAGPRRTAGPRGRADRCRGAAASRSVKAREACGSRVPGVAGELLSPCPTSPCSGATPPRPRA